VTVASSTDSFEYRVFGDITPDFVALTQALDQELRVKNGDVQDLYDGFNKLAGIHDVVLAYQGDRALGCASFKLREPGLAEVKRVYVDKTVRGLGVSKALMAHLETRARAVGIHTLLLETSRTFVEANGLYAGLGYQVCENFPPYVGLALSLCYRKRLV
jgi:GNAT superfamily N-acetyltransferase